MSPLGAAASVRGWFPAATSNALALVEVLTAVMVFESGLVVQAYAPLRMIVLERVGAEEVSGRWTICVVEQAAGGDDPGMTTVMRSTFGPTEPASAASSSVTFPAGSDTDLVSSVQAVQDAGLPVTAA